MVSSRKISGAFKDFQKGDVYKPIFYFEVKHSTCHLQILIEIKFSFYLFNFYKEY